MATWNLQQLRDKVRLVTGRMTPGEMSNDELDERINKFYQLTFPAELKLEQKHVVYELLTTANQDWYDLPNNTYTNWEPPATINNHLLSWFQDPILFNKQSHFQYHKESVWTGDGATVLFTTTISSFPLLPSSVIIADSVETFEDTNRTWKITDETITGSLLGSATVNYSTGVISVTFNTAPVDGDDIFLTYIQFQASRPHSVLMYDSQLQFFPVPDTSYKFQVKAYAVVAPLVNATDTPDLSQWGPCIAYGAARDIFADNGDMARYAEVTALYKEQLAYVLNKTNQNLLNTRSVPRF